MTASDAKPFLYLASQSPRRAELLAQLGISHQLLLADEAEDAESLETIRGLEAPAVYVQRVTHLKLLASVDRAQWRGLWSTSKDIASNNAVHSPILCADTTVALERTIYGKPQDAKDAAKMLTALAGRTHRVLTAVGLAWQVGTGVSARLKTQVRMSESRVTFAALSKREIEAYIATEEPFGKAGSYGVQGKAAAFIAKISGSYSGIMGLPLHETALLLRMAGFKGL